MRITITPREYRLAERLADLRATSVRENGSKSNTLTPRCFDAEVVGVLGEYVVAKALEFEVETIELNPSSQPDVGGYQVRSTRHERGSLIIRPRDRSEDVFVLVVIGSGWGDIKGMITGAKAKQCQWFVNPSGWGGCWMVPTSALRPFEPEPTLF